MRKSEQKELKGRVFTTAHGVKYVHPNTPADICERLEEIDTPLNSWRDISEVLDV